MAEIVETIFCGATALRRFLPADLAAKRAS
jgi:hypothetical protein